MDRGAAKKNPTYLAILESVKAINRGKKVKKINRLKTCAICTRFYSALQALSSAWAQTCSKFQIGARLSGL